MSSNLICVRSMTATDIPQVYDMMRALAEFEHYIDAFAVTQGALRDMAFRTNPDFHVQVASDQNAPDRLLGMAVSYIVPFTYTLRPELVLKELFVVDSARGRGVGRSLFSGVIQLAKKHRCYRLRWLVLASNFRARAFYSSLGADQEDNWECWQLFLNKGGLQ